MSTCDSATGIEARMLGPLRVDAGRRSAVPTAAKPRTLLALFALNPDYRLSAGSLIAELWEDRPPPSAATTLQTYVSQVRRLLAGALGVDSPVVAASLLRTVSGGYVLTPQRISVDVHDFFRYVDQAEVADREGDTDQAAALFRAAEELWSGPPLADVAHGPVLRAEVARLEQAVLCVTERRIAAEMRMGRYRTALGELASLVEQHPYHEDLHGQFMVALCRSGNRTGALEVFHRIRRAMATELGLEPSRKLRELQRAVMDADSIPDVLAAG